MNKHMRVTTRALQNLVTFFCGVLIAVVMLGLALLWFTPRANAAQPSGPVEVTHGLTLSAHHVVVESNLPHCSQEANYDPTNACSWNFDETDGNGQGLSFWYDTHGVIHYAWKANPLGQRWSWVDSNARRDLGLSMSCMWRMTHEDTYRVRCANGTHKRVTF